MDLNFLSHADRSRPVLACLLSRSADLELAHGDCYPPGNPDGVIDLADLINLQKLVW